MKIQIDRLHESPAPFRFEADADWWRRALPGPLGAPGAPAEPLRIEGSAHRMGEDLHLEGQVEGALDLECSRCLARYRQPFRESFRLVLEPAGERLPAEPEAAEALARDGLCLGDESEAGWFRGNELELGSFCRELISLALPVKPLCREDCKGLCPRCGADLSVTSCNCQHRTATSPFAVLAKLRAEPKGGEG